MSRAGPLVAVLLAGTVVVVLFRFDPAATRWFPRCPSNLITGYHCPGCGTLRALHALLHGDLAGAFSFNLAAVLTLPLLVYYGASSVAVRRGREPLPGCRRLGKSGWWIAGIFLIYAVLRNLPWAPFTYLAP